MKIFICGALIMTALLAGCGGGSENSTATQSSAIEKQLVPHKKAIASDYETTVQELYVAYFGRPADPTGLTNFENGLLAANAPTNIQDLVATYSTNPSVQSLINSFGTSTESQNLYGNGTTTAFVTAVFQNVIGRAPQQSGLTYWVNAINGDTLSQGNAALSIMAGALANNSMQGLIDAALIDNKLSVASNFTSALVTTAEISAYSGSAAGTTARSMLATVTNSTNITNFLSTINSTIATLLTENAAQYPFKAAYSNLIAFGLSKTFTISGTCSGSGTKNMNAAMPGVTFNGIAALSSTNTLTVTYTNCTPSFIAQTFTSYSSATYVPLGFNSVGVNYGVYLTQPTIPTSIYIGETGIFGTVSLYTDSTMTTSNGMQNISYIVQSGTSGTATIDLISKIYNSAGTLTATEQDYYSITTTGTLTPISTDIQYASGQTEIFTYN